MPGLSSSVMNAMLLTGHGGLDKLVYRSDVRIPHPRADEVVIRVGAAAVNNTDINMREGWYSKSVIDGGGPEGESDAAVRARDAGWTGASVSFPLIQGADVCGVIAVTGSQVPPGRIGQRVLVDPVLRDRPTPNGLKTLYLGSDCDGGFADYVCVPSVNAHPVGTSLSDAELASFPCSYVAAENMLTRAAVRAGDIVLVTGASGGVGSAAVQLAKFRRAEVIALAADSKAAQMAELGAARVLPREADLGELLGRESVDVVIDVVGGRRFSDLLGVLRSGGRYAVAGAIAGPLVTLDLRTLYLKDLSFFGCTIPDPAVFANLVRLIDGGALQPVVAKVFPLLAMADAQREFATKQHTGKIVLVP